MKLPLELELKILSYVEPNPVEYTRLAMVSKSWYSLFTSDEKWLALDFDGKKTGLFKHYLLEAYYDTDGQNYLKLCWSDWSKCKDTCRRDLYLNLFGGNRGLDIPEDDNRLSTLGLLRNYRQDWWYAHMKSEWPWINCEQYARVAIRLDYHTLTLVAPEVIQEYPDIVEYCARVHPQCLNWLFGAALSNHKELILTLLKEGETDLEEACSIFYLHHSDDDFLWEAVEYQRGLESLSEESDMEPVLKIKVAFYQDLLYNSYSRDRLKDIFSRSKQELYSDLELWRESIKAAPHLLQFASKNVQDNEDVVKQAVLARKISIWWASPRLCQDANFCAELVNTDGECFGYMDSSMQERKDFISKLTFEGFTERMLDEVPKSCWSEETALRKAMQYDVKYFHFAPGSVRQNRELALMAVEKYGNIYASLDPKLKEDKELALLALKSAPSLYEHTPPDLRGDKEIAIAAARDVKSYRLMSRELQHDKDVVLSLVEAYEGPILFNAPMHVEFPTKFWADRDVALKMVKRLPPSYFCVTDDLRMDEEIVLAAFEEFGGKDFDKRLSEDRDLLNARIEAEEFKSRALTCAATIAWVPEALRHELEIAFAALISEACNYNGFPMEVRQNKHVTTLALELSYQKLRERQVDAAFLPPELYDDEEVMSSAVRSLGFQTFSLASDRLKRQISFVSLLFDLDEGPIPLESLREIPTQVWTDRELVLKAAKIMPDILALAPLYRDDEKIIIAVLANADADPRLDLFSERLASDKEIIVHAINCNNIVLSSLKDLPSRPEWLDGACERLRTTVARYFSDNIDVVAKYLVTPRKNPAEVTYRCDILGRLSSSLRDSDEIVRICIRGGIHSESLGHASPRLLGDRGFILDAITTMGPETDVPPILSALPPALRDDEEVVRRLVRANEQNREFASDRLKRTEMKQESVSISGHFDDYNRMLALVSVNEVAVKKASEKLRDNKEFALAVLSMNRGRAEQLQYFSPRLRDDLDVVKLAFKKTVPRLELVSERLRDNTELAIMAVDEDIEQRHFVSARVREDCDFLIALLDNSPRLMDSFDPALIPEQVYNNKEKMIQLVRSAYAHDSYDLFKACTPHLRDDLDLALATMTKLVSMARESVWDFDRYEVYTKYKVVNCSQIDLLKQAVGVYTLASQRLQACPELIAQFKNIHEIDQYLIAHYLPEDLRDSKAFMMELVRLIPLTFRVASQRLRGDFDLISLAVESDSGLSVYACGDQEKINKRVAEIEQGQSSTKKQRIAKRSDDVELPEWYKQCVSYKTTKW